MLKWNFINSYHLLSKYTVLFCIVFTVNGICVLSLVLCIFYSWYIGQETAFLCSHCFCSLSYSCCSAVYRIRYQIHTVKRKHCCVVFKFILVIQVKFQNLHPIFSMIRYLPSDVLLPYTQNLATKDVFLIIVQAFSSVVVFDAI